MTNQYKIVKAKDRWLIYHNNELVKQEFTWDEALWWLARNVTSKGHIIRAE